MAPDALPGFATIGLLDAPDPSFLSIEGCGAREYGRPSLVPRPPPPPPPRVGRGLGTRLMADLQQDHDRSGFDCEFVEKPPEAVQSECPLCLLVLREPYQATCCGYGFCRVCIERIRANNRPCPCCKEESFDCFEDKGRKRSLNGYQVCCANKNQGCHWVGELGEFENHLNFNPPQEKQLEGCQFTKVQCLHCFKSFQRSSVKVHQNDQCCRRPFSCEYCNNYHSTYEDVATNHWPTCAHYPVQCPNECSNDPIERQNLGSHITNDCPLTIVDCDFKDIGCEVRLPRRDLSTHLTEGLVAHMSIQTRQLMALKEENKQLKQQVTKLTEDLQTPSCPIELTMMSFERPKKDYDKWYSPPFYSHPRGYRMCLMVRTGDCNTHVSLYLMLMKGVYDSHLSWPLRGKFTVQLLSQNGDERHHTKTVTFDASIPSSSCSRVVDGERSESGWGWSNFIPHTELRPKYQRNNCLKFCIKKVDSTGLWPFY